MAKIGKKNIGDNFPCYITFEIGPTHEGLDSAKRLIKHASDAGAEPGTTPAEAPAENAEAPAKAAVGLENISEESEAVTASEEAPATTEPDLTLPHYN